MHRMPIKNILDLLALSLLSCSCHTNTVYSGLRTRHWPPSALCLGSRSLVIQINNFMFLDISWLSIMYMLLCPLLERLQLQIFDIQVSIRLTWSPASWNIHPGCAEADKGHRNWLQCNLVYKINLSSAQSESMRELYLGDCVYPASSWSFCLKLILKVDH